MIAELGMWALVFVAGVCLISGFAHGALGFGFPIVATPLVALVIDIKSAIALLAPLTLVLVVISVLRGGRLGALLREYWFMPLAMALGAWFGTRLLLAAPPEPFILVLAAVILLYLNIDRLGRGTSPLVHSLRVPFGVAFGLVAGTFEALANVAGPILLIYFMLLGLAPSQIVQALNLCFTFGKGSQVLSWATAGAMTPATWAAVGALTAPSVAALFAGMRLRDRIDAVTYRRWLRKALWLMAGLLIGQFVISLPALATDAELFAAIAQGDERLAQELVMGGRADVNARNAQHETALQISAEKGMRTLARTLLERGADVQARSKNGETALHLAALNDDADLLEALLAAGADPRSRNKDGESVLYWAALSGNLAAAQRLLERGADANVTDVKGNSPLHAAADGGQLELVRLFLRNSRDPALKNRAGLTALDYARQGGYDEIAQLLKGANQ
jgi:uncharacterized protein